jgi:hypothetical protein
MMEKIEHRLGVRTPAKTIWAIIADTDQWSEWNPLYPKAQGAIRIGSRLELEMALPGRDRRSIRPVIVDWVPNEQVIWRLSLFGGLLKSRRYIEIEALTETGCIFSNGEIFEGLLAPFLGRRMRADIRAGFAAMGEAVKARAEAAWRPEGGVPT